MSSDLVKLAERITRADKPCSCGSGKTAKVCGCRHGKGSEVEKLSMRLKVKCHHCGVKHASDGSCGCSDRRYGQPRQAAKDADRRRPATDYPPAKMAEDEKLRSSTMDTLIPIIGSGSPLLAGALGAYDAPKDHGWSHFWRTMLGSAAGHGAGQMVGGLTGHTEPAIIASILAGAAGTHLGRRAALERELKERELKERELKELVSGSKKESSARSQIDLLRQKIAVAPLLAAGGAAARAAIPAVGRALTSNTAKTMAGHALGGAAMQGGMNMMAPKTPA